MYKYLHIMHDGHPSVARNFMYFINKFYNEEEHCFIMVSSKEDELIDRLNNVIRIKAFDTKQILPMIKKSKYVFLHSLFMRTDMKLYMLLNRRQMNKIVWVAWGMDLYEEKKTGRIKAFIIEQFKRNIRYFIGIFPPDIEYFQTKYGKRAAVFHAPYGGIMANPLYEKDPVVVPISEKVKNGKTVNILIGHQGNPKLNHIRVIDKVASFKDENIKVVIPLSYGFREYAAGVAAHAEKKLGDKACVLREFMEYDKYMDLLRSIDIAIFDTDRQIALGNVRPLLFMQKKLYLDGVMYNYYREKGLNVCKADAISDFSDFVADVDMSNATAVIREECSLEYRIEKWNSVFEVLR